MFYFSLSIVPAAHAAPTAVSSYVQAVLDRADEGIVHAKSAGSIVDFLTYARDILEEVTSSQRSLIDTRLRITERQKSLAGKTACLRADLFLLETKMERVRAELLNAYTEGKFLGVIRLRSLLRFLNERIDIVLHGAHDPNISDRSWPKRRAFDLHAPSDQPLCPFDSDYLPPSVTGYGCDEFAMADVLDRLPEEPQDGEPDSVDPTPIRETVEREAFAQGTVSASIDSFVQDARTFLALQVEIDRLLGRETPNAQEPHARGHQRRSGCPAPEEDPWPSGAIASDLRGLFSPSPEKDEERLLGAFQDLRASQEAMRETPQYLEPNAKSAVWERDMRAGSARTLRSFNIERGIIESHMFALGSDPRLAIDEAVRPFTESVNRLSHLAHDVNGGLRGFVRNFAYFLRRSCMYRPCRERLHRVLKIVFQDACFPYTNGEYLEDDPRNPRWQQCAKAACIRGLADEGGNAIEFGEECVGMP